MTIRITCEHYTIAYDGGRLATLEVYGRPVEGVPVRQPNRTTEGFAEPEPSEAQLRERVAEWVDLADMPNYREQAIAQANAERAHERSCTDPRCQCGKRR